jgi:DNA adenine methylase
VQLKSCISRIGGKGYLTSWLSGFIAEHITYVEPFAGGAKLLFAKEPSPVEVLNDTDDNLVNLYRCIQNPEKRVKLISFLNEIPYARSVFQSWKYGDETTQNDIEKAGRYFFLCKASFAGDVERGGFGMPSKGTGRNPVQSFRNAVDSLKAIAERLRNVCIENLDYQECIKRYDSPETLFYVDCPYYGHEHFYGDTFTQDDHRTLAELLHGIKGKVMVSHYDNELYSTLYKGWNKYTYQSFKGSHKAEPGIKKPVTVECLYTNFEPVKTRGLFDENILA